MNDPKNLNPEVTDLDTDVLTDEEITSISAGTIDFNEAKNANNGDGHI